MTNQVQGCRLSAQQRRLWRLREAGCPAWAQALVRVDGGLDADRLRAALAGMVRRHEILRTSYRRVPGTHAAVQVLREEAAPAWRIEDLRHLDQQRRRWRVTEVARSERDTPFDLDGGPVMRVVLFVTGDDRHAVLLTTTALAADGGTLRRLVAETAAEYAAAAPDTRDVPQYAQFAQGHEQEPPAGGRRHTPLDIPLRLSRPADGWSSKDIVDDVLRPGTGAAVRAYAAARSVRPGAVLLAALQVLLWKVTGQADVTVGAVLDERPYEGCLGHFTTWVALNAGLEPGLGLDPLVSGVDSRLDKAEEPGDGSGWDVAFDCRPAGPVHASAGVTFAVDWDDVESEPYAIKLECLLAEDAVTARWHYRSGQFAADYVRCLATQYRTLLAGLVAAPAAPVRAVGALDETTRAELLTRFNETGLDDSGPDRCLHELFEAQVARCPDAAAVIAGGERVTYRDLNARANRLARWLAARGVGPEVRVAVGLDHGADLLVGLLAVLKAGGAYVPLDPALPARRARDLMSRAGCRLLLAAGGAASEWARAPVERVDLRRLPAEVSTADASNRPASALPDNLAYVMFTSGSTGAPKGVMLPHRAVVNYVRWAAGTYGGADGDTGGALLHSSIAFDLTVTSLFVPLVTGRPVRAHPRFTDIAELCAELARRRGLDLLKLTPSHLTLVNQLLDPADLAGTAGSLVVGGEALTGEAVRPWRRHAPATRIINEYGPTEAAVGCCVHEVRADADGPLPIGRPIANTEIYVLGADLEPVPVGVPGEIYIGGRALARGYLGRPDLTAERFVAHPFSRVPGQRLYRTGDLACHAPDGELRYLGRVDDQIKIRGIRVEPGEIRAALVRHPAVRDAVALLADDPDRGPTLVAYLVASGSRTVPEVDLRAFLARRLPAHLVPEGFAWVDALPLTANGKLDRQALPPVSAGRRGSQDAVPPRDTTELRLAGIFEETLATAPIGIRDSFFDLGGHSMTAVRLMARVNEAFGVDLPVAVLFAEPAGGSDGPPVPSGSVQGLARLLRAEATARPTNGLVTLARRGTGRPLFCVHPAGGDVSGFRDLATVLSGSRPVYALEPPPDAGEVGIAELAGQYLDLVRAAVPAPGPYHLLGWSMGGLIAYEVARRLRAAGDRVGSLTLVESYAAGQLPERDEAGALADFVDELERRYGTELGVDRIRQRPAGEAVACVLDRATATGVVSSEAERDDLRRRIRLHWAHLRAAQRYAPGPYDGPVLLVQARDQDTGMRESAARDWARRCGARVDRHVLDGDHFSIMRRPHVDGVVRLLGDPGSQR